jgi:hypothetical protein
VGESGREIVTTRMRVVSISKGSMITDAACLAVEAAERTMGGDVVLKVGNATGCIGCGKWVGCWVGKLSSREVILSSPNGIAAHCHARAGILKRLVGLPRASLVGFDGADSCENEKRS